MPSSDGYGLACARGSTHSPAQLTLAAGALPERRCLPLREGCRHAVEHLSESCERSGSLDAGGEGDRRALVDGDEPRQRKLADLVAADFLAAARAKLGLDVCGELLELGDVDVTLGAGDRQAAQQL